MIFSTTARSCTIGLIGLFSLVITASSLIADDGQPVAIRKWSGGALTVETMWGFQVELGTNVSNEQALPRESDLKTADVSPGKSKTLQRLPNQAKLSILDEATAAKDGNSVVVSKNETGSISSVSIDGLTIVDLNGAGADAVVKLLNSGDEKPLGFATKGQQLAVIATGDDFDEKACGVIYDMLKPRLIVVNSKLTKVSNQEVEAVAHNTVAVSAQKRSGLQKVAIGFCKAVSRTNEFQTGQWYSYAAMEYRTYDGPRVDVLFSNLPRG